jgi:hypothetical protein
MNGLKGIGKKYVFSLERGGKIQKKYRRAFQIRAGLLGMMEMLVQK